MLSTAILAAAGARSSFFWRRRARGDHLWTAWALAFCLLLVTVYELVALEGMHQVYNAQSIVFLPLLYPAWVLAGIAAREVIERGAMAEADADVPQRRIAVQNERLRVAREMHGSLAKTVEGLSMMASALPTRCERNAVSAGALARQLAPDAGRRQSRRGH